MNGLPVLYREELVCKLAYQLYKGGIAGSKTPVPYIRKGREFIFFSGGDSHVRISRSVDCVSLFILPWLYYAMYHLCSMEKHP